MADFSDEDLWKRDEVDSPCVKICVIHPTARLCVGCNRSIDEIATWSRLDHAERRRIDERQNPGSAWPPGTQSAPPW